GLNDEGIPVPDTVLVGEDDRGPEGEFTLEAVFGVVRITTGSRREGATGRGDQLAVDVALDHLAGYFVLEVVGPLLVDPLRARRDEFNGHRGERDIGHCGGMVTVGRHRPDWQQAEEEYERKQQSTRPAALTQRCNHDTSLSCPRNKTALVCDRCNV